MTRTFRHKQRHDNKSNSKAKALNLKNENNQNNITILNDELDTVRLDAKKVFTVDKH